MQIVADTNTVVSGLFWQGAPRQLLELGRNQQITLVTSPALLAELAEVLARDKFATRIHLAKLSIKALVEDYAGIAQVNSTPVRAGMVRKPADYVWSSVQSKLRQLK